MSSSELLAARPFPLARGLVLRNRLVGTAHAAGLVSGGLALPEDADYWRRRAAGGAAMLVVGGTVTAPESTWRRRIVTEAWREEAVPGMAARAQAIRGEGAVAACQLVHLGRETTGAEMWFPPVAPSAVRSPREPVRPRPLTDGEVDAIIEGFRVSAVNALAAGFQVIELHAAHGYLLGQFLSAVTNQRPGASSLAARAGIIARITDAIRRSAPGAVVGIRLSTDGGEEAGLTLDGLCELLPRVSPLVDYINLTVGVRTTYVRDMATAEPPLLPHLARIRPLTSRPLLVSQAFRRADQIDAALAAGADLVGMARPLIADPDLPVKLLSGRAAQVRPCVSCNEDCRTFDPVLLCSVNPELAPDGAARRPAVPLLVQQADAGQGDRVAVVGTGPAGLECAVTLAGGGALAGAAEVVVFEQRDVIGGELAVAAAAPNRTGWQALLDFYQASLDAGGVTLRLGTTAGPADLAGFGEVVLAVGSEEVLPEVAGIERAVASSLAIAAGPSALAGRDHLLIVDDGFGSWSCASAVELGVRAAVPRITVVTPGAAFGASLPAEGRVQLIARLRGAPLDVLSFTALSFAGDGCAELRNTMSGAIRRIAADAVIVVGERRARDWRSLVPSGPKGPTVRVIGDALVPRRVAHAISEGRAAAEAIRASRANLPVTAALA
jgi:2,4-dienoyl-CoA reductase-like NADH-dependent reductase (Old Yellow Enzyme family)